MRRSDHLRVVMRKYPDRWELSGGKGRRRLEIYRKAPALKEGRWL